MLVAEMLAIHFCSDHNETLQVLAELLEEIRRRVRARAGVLGADAVRVFWVNPVADLRTMNLLEDAGGRVCGSDYLFCHALDRIPTDLPPLEALGGWRWPTRWWVRPRSGPRGSARMFAASARRPSSFRASPGPAIVPWKGR